MIVNQGHFISIVHVPRKDYSPLVVYSNCIKPFKFTVECMKTIARRYSQVIKVFRCINHV